jgi:DNA-binding MarR family transcriptional regulator
MTQVYDEALQPSGLRATQFNVLVALALTSTISLTQLAEALVMDRTTLARNLKPLESQGLLVIDTGTDRRVRLLRLTDHGRHALTEALPYWHQAQEHVTTCLGQELSRALLEELNAAMKLASSQ